MLNPEVKKDWLTALRSGEYQQTKGTLKRGDSYCCLGVLCEVLPDVSWSRNDARPAMVIGGMAYSSTSIPPVLRERIGLEETEMTYLIRMNDSYGAPFDGIADYIERAL
jgi:hypothetical protein